MQAEILDAPQRDLRDYMTDEERQEALVLGRQIFPQEYIDNRKSLKM